ncbi:cytidine deaminase [Candidatus Woesebacteria bacterium]|nr:cytidine deaminase [Candidatus Woesebacteria bacterium]
MSESALFHTLRTHIQPLLGRRELTTDVSVAKVACAVQTSQGNIYTGINMSTSCDLGFCAEVSALAQMIQAGETRVSHVVGMNDQGEIIPPCGRCRELLFQIDRANIDAQIFFRCWRNTHTARDVAAPLARVLE